MWRHSNDDTRGRPAVNAREGLTELRRSLKGDVLAPSDPEYEAARLCFNLLIDRRPAAIVEVAVRGGGHNPALRVDEGLVIDLSRAGGGTT